MKALNSSKIWDSADPPRADQNLSDDLLERLDRARSTPMKL